ncbi:hypothetical protein [Fredinandcohnia onubensis]|uniref:hypothetical protein n=1 Tax=Fredinandcohnia onubensis TaxID=1571209 RepID=UPI000C0BE011|nr:hypothetical protein [Fredinandcohnia onubensis]
MKRSIFLVFLAVILFFTAVFEPAKSSAEGVSDSLSNSIKNGHTETFYDEFGNTTELEYLINDDEFRVNTFVNGKLVDYSTREVKDDGTYSDEITYNQLLSVEEPSLNNKVTNSKVGVSTIKEVTFKEVNEVKKYNVNEFIKVGETEPAQEVLIKPSEDLIAPTEKPITLSSSYTLPRPYSFIWSRCNWTLNQCGSLYGKSDSTQIKYFMFDFKRDIAISVVAAAITVVFSTVIVAIGVLLVSLGVSYSLTRLTESLNGYYDATRKRYSYYVVVKQRETFKHNQAQYDVYYYNQRNGKKSTRVKRTGSWMSESAILDVGIISY